MARFMGLDIILQVYQCQINILDKVRRIFRELDLATVAYFVWSVSR